MNNKNTQGIVEGAMLSGIAVIIAIASAYIPFLSFLYVVFPVPIAVIGYRHGLKISLLSLIVASVIIAILSGPLSLLGTMGLGSIGIGIGYFQKLRVSPVTTLFGAFFIGLFSILLSLWIASKIAGINVVSQNIDAFRQAMQLNIEIYKKMGIQGQALQDINVLMQNMLAMLKMLMPFIIMASVFIVVFINYLVNNMVLKRLGYKDVATLPPFSTWIMPRSAAIIFSLFVVAGFFIKAEAVGQNVVHVINNFLAIGFVAFFIDGLSLATFYMKKAGMNGFFKTIIFIMLLFYGYFNMLVFVIGLLDAGLDFRHLRMDSRR
ncbi:Uncharacterized conserved protein YybS, DUF2232 family [Caldanaerobius fijiensis DSM 17918]|uniref:Uncharacterized conserved protein YybS, DUF2232 family n=1 Tax=Caldanaerobius fijiensis DSM 17918 TaxID=1121256 RepID=A0A1M5ARF7_9THEO|nr:DUF2232 domain-containing protein [Caldanaerobius fijiensis]SHF32841.1 Uncharacterized conserved protein YybS, DUF2232 family [Caldanaerobius fijiensis DSM 17918]